MTLSTQTYRQRPALVSRPPAPHSDADEYLVMAADGRFAWTRDPATATPFESMREAMRAAARLPGSLRAYGLPMPSAAGPLSLH